MGLGEGYREGGAVFGGGGRVYRESEGGVYWGRWGCSVLGEVGVGYIGGGGGEVYWGKWGNGYIGVYK